MVSPCFSASIPKEVSRVHRTALLRMRSKALDTAGRRMMMTVMTPSARR